jgi:hypothetical protein
MKGAGVPGACFYLFAPRPPPVVCFRTPLAEFRAARVLTGAAAGVMRAPSSQFSWC